MSNGNAKALVGKWKISKEGNETKCPWTRGLPEEATFELREDKGEFEFIPGEKCAGLFAKKKSFEAPPAGAKPTADGRGELTMKIDYEGSTATITFTGDHSKKHKEAMHIFGPGATEAMVTELGISHGGPHGEPV
jgi:hypothetical protein